MKADFNFEDILSRLTNTALFKGIGEDESVAFLEKYPYKIKYYDKGDLFAMAGDRCNKMMIVLEGELLARMDNGAGKYVVIDRIGINRIIAPAILFAQDNRFPVTVQVEKPTALFVMEREIFLKSMQEHERILFNFIQSVSDINRFLSEKIRFLSLKSIKGKLGQYLFELKPTNTDPYTVMLPVTRQDLADKFGVSRQSLVRTLSELEEENIISINHKMITIIDLKKLRTLE